MTMTLDGTLGITATGSLTGLTTAITVAQGGTGLTTVGSSGNLLTSNGTAWTSTAPAAPSTSSLTDKIQPITASVASSALTITLNPTTLDFRASPLTSGTITTIAVPSTISVTIPSTSTMGTVSAQQSRIVVIAINNAGTVELAAVNISGGSVLDETTLITTTAAVAAGNSATAYYSTTARTSVAYRVVGYIESTQATAGTWVTAPSTIQGYGGQALAAMSSLGYGQTWQDLTASRAAGTTYYNTTGRPIIVNPTFTPASNSAGFITVNSNTVSFMGNYSNGSSAGNIIIPPNASYNMNAYGTLAKWWELR
jgi:hypothetical protein